MSMNPEFERNIWLEMTPHRLIAAPLVFGLLLFLALSATDYVLDKDIAYAALILFVLFTGVWGTKQATAAVFDEVAQRTWDWQRMSGLDPWSMTWGKLFGSTLFSWYGGAICLLVAAIGLQAEGGGEQHWRLFLLALFSTLFSQALGFLISLLYVRSRPLGSSRMRGSLYLLVLLLIFLLVRNIAEADGKELYWYGRRIEALDFAIYSILLFWFWSVLGAYRVMRRELSHAARPWVWLLFLGFSALYLGGLSSESAGAWLFTAFIGWCVLTYAAIFVESKDPVQIRGLLTAIRQRDPRRVLQLTPSWLTSLLLAAAAVLLMQLLPVLHLSLEGRFGTSAALLAALLLLFLLRDLAIFLMLGFSGEARRAEVTAVVYLLVLYGIIPALLMALDLERLSVFFLPRPDLTPLLAFFGAASGMVIAVVLMLRQWRRLERV